MNDKEMVIWIRGEFSDGQSRADVVRKLQSRGYKLEYIELMLGKASVGRRVLKYSLIVLATVFVFCLALVAYVFLMAPEKQDVSNPLAGYNLVSTFGMAIEGNENITIEEIEVNSEFVSYLLNSIGAWQLKTSVLNGKRPLIKSEVDEKTFFSEVRSGKIITTESFEGDADLVIKTNKKVVVDAMFSDNPKDVFILSLKDGSSSIEQVASQAELFAKGYLNLYNSLQ